MSVNVSFEGKTALVTGAAKGIGAACARRLADAEARVAINYRSSEDSALALADEIRADGGEAKAFGFDISDRSAVSDGIAAIEQEFDGIDLLVNNAGARYDNLTHRMTAEDWERSLADNLTGVFNVTKVCLEGMMKRRFGRIVMVSSIAAQIGSLGQSNYAAAKAGAIALMKSVATEYAGRNIRANAVIPGIVATDMTKDLKAELAEHYISRIPLKRFGKPEEVADVVLFLLSELSSYITGATISVNGGGLMI
ncbi:SDR family oxidoreductase [bacterium]|nr:SDR family oxidoreductase [bacterium]